ncbi:hypothetical protein G6F23_014560 [Rhizopus arrhizus]|nr:hypothetical protein G6F23_014560 [Rhizopus arrhizus]
MNLEIRAGEILALIGPNGAGKSTMVNKISGVDTPTSGQVTLLGQSVAGVGARKIARLGLSRTFQHVRLLSRMSVLENVAIGAHLRIDGAEATLMPEAASNSGKRFSCARNCDEGGSMIASLVPAYGLPAFRPSASAA